MADLGSLLGSAGIGGAIGKAIVSLELDTKKYSAEMKAAQAQTVGSTNAMSSSLASFGGIAKAGMGAAALGVVAFGAVSIKAASDLGESLNKSNVVFGQNAAAIEKWAHTGAEGFGLSARAALDAAANFGTMLQSAGVATSESAKLSQNLVQLAGDLASFNNVDPTIALEKLRSGLAGEAEPLRQFGVFLDEASVQQEAYQSGLAKVGAELTQAQKIQARYNIIFEQTTKQQGDFQRTADSLPNQLRTMRAEFENISAEVGTSLLPAMTDLLGAVKELMPVITFLGAHLLELGAIIAAFAVGSKLAAAGFTNMGAALGPVTGMIIGAIETGKQLNDIFYGTDQTLQSLTQTLTGKLEPALDAGTITTSQFIAANAALREQSFDSIGVLLQVWGAIERQRIAEEKETAMKASAKVAADSYVQSLQDQADASDVATTAADEQAAGLRRVLEATLALFDPTFALIHAVQDNAAAEEELTDARRDLNRLAEDGKKGTDAYREALDRYHESVTGAAESQADLITSALALRQAVQVGKTDMDAAVDSIRDIGKAAGLSGAEIKTLVGIVRRGLTDAANVAASLAPTIGKSITQGIVNGIHGGEQFVYTTIDQVIQNAITSAQHKAEAHSPSKVFHRLGVDMMVGLANGISDAEQKAIDATRKAMEKVIDQVSSQLDKVKGKASSFADTIKGAFSGFMDIGGAFGSAEEGTSLSDVISQQVGGATVLADVLEALKRQGAGKALLSQVAESGSAFGQAILAGGPEQVKEMNEALKTISNLAQQTGKGLSEDFFGKSINRVENKLDKLHDDLRELNALEREGHSHDIVMDGQKVAEGVRNELVKTGKRNDGTGINP